MENLISERKELYAEIGEIIYLNHNGKLKLKDKTKLSKTFSKIDKLTKKIEKEENKKEFTKKTSKKPIKEKTIKKVTKKQ